MADIDDEIARLYQGPLEDFTDRRNALAKAAKRPDVKTLGKPSVPAWVVNQLFWHQRPVLDRLVAASEAVLTEHRRRLAGEPSDIPLAEQAHKEALRAALAAAREALSAGHQAATPATLEAVRETLSALPSAEANGRLTRPLTPRGLDALAGLKLAARAPGPILAPVTTRAAARPSADSPAGDAAARAARERARAAEKAAKAREAARRKADAALDRARTALAAADAAVAQAERDLATRQASRAAAREAFKRAQRAVEELSFGR